MRKIEQVVSRYEPVFEVPGLHMGFGRDGNVYLVVGGKPDGRALRLRTDGTQQRFARTKYSVLAVTADAAGVIAIAEGHFRPRVVFYDPDFRQIGHYDDFTTNDAVGYFAPGAVEAAGSGAFYAVDQYVRRVLKLSPQGLEKAIPLTGLPDGVDPAMDFVGLRVSESADRLYTAWRSARGVSFGFVCATGLDGALRWYKEVKVSGDAFGGFDVSEDGRLHVVLSGQGKQRLVIYDAQGTDVTGTSTLGLPDDEYAVQDLRIHGDRYYVKRNDPRYLFEVYDRASGARLDREAVPADVEQLTVQYDADVWTAGERMPLTVTHTPGNWADRPGFRVWLRPLGVPEFTELPLSDGAVVPAADARGLYHVRVSPDVAGRHCEYVVDSVVEIRPPGAVSGSLSLMSCRIVQDGQGDPARVDLNRLHYGRGEAVTVAVQARVAPGVPLPAAVHVVLKQGGTERNAWDIVLDGRGSGTLEVGADVTGTLEPGRYVVDADAPPGFTVAPQYLDIGPGLMRRPDFHLTMYSDIYAPNDACFPVDPRAAVMDPTSTRPPGFADLPDVVQAHLSRAAALGLNLAVDRLGALGWSSVFAQRLEVDADLTERLTKSPFAVHPDKAVLEDVGRRVIAGYGAYGIEEQAILHQNDTILPLAWPGNYEPRTLPELKLELTKVTGQLGAYAAFRGWTWAANWWNGPVGVAAAQGDTETHAYTDAVDAIDNGGRTWVPVLDTVTDRSISLKPDEAEEFRETLKNVAPGLTSALTRPYYAVQTPPSLLFDKADEVDLHYQGEQIQIPLATAHMVDLFRRPGKPLWGHPELSNDDGTGGMILPTLFQQVMRGPNGTGLVCDEGIRQVEPVAAELERGGGSGSKRGEPRAGGAGRTSVQRAAFDLIGRLGPAIAGAEGANRVAIVVSTRMQRLETTNGWRCSTYFARLYEAYNACLYARRPASFVHTEDVSADVLRGYQAVLLVGQRVDLDPRLEEALRAVHAEPPQKPGDKLPPGKVPVYADATCHDDIIGAFHPLGIAFDDVKPQLDPDLQNDDTLYHRLRRVFLTQGAAVAEALRAVTPVAECDSPEVLLSEWTAGKVTYIWAVNNTMPDWGPEFAWRVGLLCAQRLPVTAKLKVRLPALHQVVDLLTGKAVSLIGGGFTADLRTVPARLYAIAPLPHGPLPSASEEGFGPHVRDIAVSADGGTAVLNAFNWDHNLYGLDLDTGTTSWRQRVGHHFAYAPTARPGGFAVQGFDLNSPEGYHLYLLDPDGNPERRFALFGLPKKATDWSKSDWGHDYGLNNFAVAPGGSWTATSGDLGLAVWEDKGNDTWSERWAHPCWTENRRAPLRLLALDDDTLITFADNTITGLSAADGTTLWTVHTAVGASFGGAFGAGAVSGDRRTAVIASEAEGGRLYVIRGGALANTIPSAAGEVSVSADGSFLAVTAGNQLKAFDTGGGLLWTYTGDDFLRRPRVSPDGTRVAVGSELGTLSVLTRDGGLLAATDLRALPVPAWLPDGDLVVATWMGTVIRYDTGLEERWRTRLVPVEQDIRPKLLAADPVPVVRRTDWGNARSEPRELTPNLLTSTHALLDMSMVNPHYPMGPQPSDGFGFELLTDGSADPPPAPWLNPTLLSTLGSSGSDHRFVFTADAFRYQLELTGVTIAEDPAHPRSWMRDVLLQWWDARNGVWQDGPMLLSDQALHSHDLDPHVKSSRFRFVTTGGGTWPEGNIRLGELVFHGEVLGNSHRDVLDDNGLAVLFDDREDDVRDLLLGGRQVDIQQGGAYSGTRCLRVPGPLPGGQYPVPSGAFHEAMHDWEFEIVENPSAPGQYRHLQFAWKALGTATTGIGLRIGATLPTDGNGRVFGVNAGISQWPSSSLTTQLTVPDGEFPATDWKRVRLDLWKLGGGLTKITQLAVRTDGGGALFDQIVLGRTEADLPERQIGRGAGRGGAADAAP